VRMLRDIKTHPRYHRKDAMKTASLAPTEPAARMSGKAFMTDRDQRHQNRGSVWRRNFYAYSTASVVLLLLALLAACTSEPSKPAEPAKPEVKGPELITARSAFQRLYIAARGWNQDAKPYRLDSVATSDGNGHDGKWAIWHAGFASPTRRSAKTYTWSGSAADGAPARGVNPGIE